MYKISAFTKFRNVPSFIIKKTLNRKQQNHIIIILIPNSRVFFICQTCLIVENYFQVQIPIYLKKIT